jgi:hypothetical protein
LDEFPAWTDATVRTEAARFADFWHSKPGKDGCKLDWLATWRNWCRDARRPVGLKSGAGADASQRDADAMALLGFSNGGEVVDA